MIFHAIVAVVILFTTVAGDLILDSTVWNYNTSRLFDDVRKTPYKDLEIAGDPIPGPSDPPPVTPDGNTPYGKAWCRGSRLNLAMTLDTEKAKIHIQPMPSPWDGELKEEMNKWGYKDDSANITPDSQCDFEDIDGIGRTFRDLQIPPESHGDGGPNRCYKAIHWAGPAVIRGPPPEEKLPPIKEQKYKVDGKEYRVTGAFHTIGVNPDNGVVYFITRSSAKSSAKDLWGRDPTPDELPALQASSDIAWGFYNQAYNSKKRPLNHITKLMSLTIVNDETKGIIKKAISQWKPPPGKLPLSGVPKWPGVEFATSTEEGLALLGTANGLAVGFFLAQHKAQLGLKYVSKITIFTDDGALGFSSNMLFWVKDVPPPKDTKPGDDPTNTGPGDSAGISESPVMKRSRDGRNFVREHIFYAKL